MQRKREQKESGDYSYNLQHTKEHMYTRMLPFDHINIA